MGDVCLQPNRGSDRKGKMLEKQERDAAPVPVMPEVAVHHDGGLRRPAREVEHPATAAASVRTALEAALPARVAQMFTPPPPPPRFSRSTNPPNSPTSLCLRSASAFVERASSGPRPRPPRGLPFLLFYSVPANPAGIRPDGASPLGTHVTVRRPANGRWATHAVSGETNTR